jgi:DNA polymerase-3 subunit alpha
VPDINLGRSDFAPVIGEDGSRSIIFGLSAVRNVGEGLVELIVAERDANGPFADFYDFCERVNTTVLNKRTVESLIKAGSFDGCGHPRRGLLVVFEQVVDQIVARRRERDMGVMSLFGDLDTGGAVGFDERTPVPDLEFDKKQRLAFEKEMLGLYVSDHPLMGVERLLSKKVDCAVLDLAECEDGARRTVGGVITNLQRKWTRKGDLMAVFTLEDLNASVEVMVFPKAMAEHGHKLADDAVVLITGRVDRREDVPKLIPQQIDLFEVQVDATPDLRIQVSPNVLSDSLIERLRALLAEFPGESEVYLHLGGQILRLPDRFCADTDSGLAGELRVLLGPDAIL